MPPSTPLTIRKANKSDLKTISTIIATANMTDPFFGTLIHPHRNTYPQDMHLYWLKRLLKAWGNPNCIFLVSVIHQQAHNNTETITGMAQWTRRGNSVPLFVQETEVDEEVALLPVNRAADPDMEGIIERSVPYLPQVWTGDRLECWHLNRLAIHPHFQGQHHGTALVNYGLALASEENVAASLISTAKEGVADKFYTKCGFNFIGVKVTEGEGNPLSGTEGGEIMFKDRI